MYNSVAINNFAVKFWDASFFLLDTYLKVKEGEMKETDRREDEYNTWVI